MEAKFYNKNGDLSFYSFCCGYVQRKEKKNMRKELFMEHETFHVKAYRVNGDFIETTVWDSFSSLTEAREKYKSFKL